MALDLDFLTEIVNINWDVEEQALLVTSSNPLIAVALDTGETFSGVNSGASGQLLLNTFTVLSKGIVVYGKPRNGDACFMACVDEITILRGVQDIDGDMEGIVWSPIHSVPLTSGRGLTALSFAGDAFFITYSTDTDYLPFCAVSFDGVSFSEIGNIYPSVPLLDVGGEPNEEKISGAIAHNGTSYAAAGMFDTTPSHYSPTLEITPADYAMMWGFSGDATNWSSGYSPDEVTNPGANPAPVFTDVPGGFTSTVGFTNIAGGNGLFVAAATTREGPFIVQKPTETFTIATTRPTASAAISSNGSSWITIRLPGAIQGNYIYDAVSSINIYNSRSVAASVAFIKTGAKSGYFVISATGDVEEHSVQTSAGSWCWKGDGSSWSLVKQAGEDNFGTVSAIAKDLSSTKIVRI